MRQVAFLLVSILIAGCTTYGGKWNHQRYGTYDPSPSNNYRGLISYEPGADYYGYMRKVCNRYGGLDPKSVRDGKSTKIIFNNFGFVKEYKCYGPPASTNDNYQKEVIQYENRDAEKRNKNDDVPKMIDETTLHGGTKQPPVSETVTMDAAKAECEGLGFKPKTEAFGNCVLKLTE